MKTRRLDAGYKALAGFMDNATLPEVRKRLRHSLSNREVKLILKDYLHSQGE